LIDFYNGILETKVQSIKLNDEVNDICEQDIEKARIETKDSKNAMIDEGEKSLAEIEKLYQEY
jgi:hypothetical protein